jgi:selenocysteine-specific elongation factor
MFVVGTAGHIDHGKSTLVKVLTGMDPDRLPEEKERGLTIDLGFAWFDLPSGESVGIVDVPGHERFIKNMVAGVGAIDAVMFVVAADDGWMPQSAEHLEILSLLDIKSGIIILTKTDLADNDHIALQKMEVSNRLKNTFLENAPIISFSAKDDSGKEEIIESLQLILTKDIKKPAYGSPRLYIDRSFVLKGIGTVVTGTLLEGEFKIGQELEICPIGQKVRIRSLQTHKQSIQTAVPGSRVALNLTGVVKEDAPRGSALVMPGKFQPTKTLGVKVKILPGAELPLKTGSEIIVLLGTSVSQAKIRLFSKDNLMPGAEDFAVIHLEENICCRLGDKFIIRRISPARTIGGGVVLDWDFASVKQRKPRQLEILRTRQNLDLKSLIESELLKSSNIDAAKLKLNSIFTPKQIDDYLAGSSEIIKAGDSLVHKGHLDKYFEPSLSILAEDHRHRPWVKGMTVGDFARKLKLPAKEISELVDYLLNCGKIFQELGYLRLASHTPHLNNSQQELASKLHAILSARPLSSPLKKEFVEEDEVYEIVIDFLRDQNDLIELKGGLLFTIRDFQRITEQVVTLLKAEKRVTASRIKDYLGTSRKYVIPLLEKFDALGVTIRDGDFRTLGDRA